METDEDLMRRLQQADMSALDALYERHSDRLWKYLHRRLPHKAEDLFQECFARLIERRDQWRGAPFLPWLLVLARNLLIDEVRREKRTLPNFTDENISSSEVEEWLEDLSVENRRLVREHYLEGFSYQELATKYQTVEATLRQKMSRALRSIRGEK